MSTPTRRPWLWLIAIGLVAGFMSGMFGVGGGILIVPALIYLARLEPRLAAGTSLLAIFPVAIVGVTTYGIGGHVDVLLALLLAVGSILGAPLGSWLLSKVSRTALQLAFIAFMLVVIVSLFIVIPSRDAEVDITWVTGPLIFLLGFIVGIMSGLLGIGGGVVIVPMLVLLFGSSDLIAKGSSLLMMIGTSISGTISNILRKNVDVPSAIVVGVCACFTTTLGAIVAAAVSPLAANIAFAVFLVLIVIRMLVDVINQNRRTKPGA
ncbi:UPF0721 transmembrane protein [Pseudoclavibacter endophyticus]|nr:sulfite exporter TauE/SafE family protein [Pseudoclavibacter endophyticus]GGA75379.1 UPF0721 transmembrane protein [Pseudoclavibacter endophyticus]